MKQTRVAFVLRQCNLPTDAEAQQQFRQDACSALTEAAAYNQVFPSSIRVFDGPSYTQIKANCPVCRNPLQFQHVELDPENGAKAPVTCLCGWSGRAIFRLIELQDDNADTSDKITDYSSCVTEHNLYPKFYPYKGTDEHFFDPTEDYTTWRMPTDWLSDSE